MFGEFYLVVHFHQGGSPINGTNVPMVGGKPNISQHLSPNLVYTIYPILVCHNYLVKSWRSQLPHFMDIKNHINFKETKEEDKSVPNYSYAYICLNSKSNDKVPKWILCIILCGHLKSRRFLLQKFLPCSGVPLGRLCYQCGFFKVVQGVGAVELLDQAKTIFSHAYKKIYLHLIEPRPKSKSFEWCNFHFLNRKSCLLCYRRKQKSLILLQPCLLVDIISCWFYHSLNVSKFKFLCSKPVDPFPVQTLSSIYWKPWLPEKFHKVLCPTFTFCIGMIDTFNWLCHTL